MRSIHSSPRLIVILILACCAAALFPAPILAKESLVLALGGEPEEGFDPIMGWGRYGHSLFHSTLLTRDNDLNVVHDLATAWKVSADGKRWSVTLRPGVRFSDGTPLTADDVAFTFNQAATTGGKADLTRLERAVATGPASVEFILKQPDSTFINRLITLGIVPRHAYGEQYDRHPIGSGPFILKSWVEGEQMIAERNPTYYGSPSPFKRLVFLYGNEDTMFNAAKAGQVDMVAVPAYLAVQKLPGMRIHAVKSVDNRGLMFPMLPDRGEKTATGAPIGNSVTADPAIRRAINTAIDRKALVAGILEGFGRPAYFVCDDLPWDNPENRFADADPEGARRILAAAGWKDGNGDGILEKNGLVARFNLVYPAGDSVRQGLALAVADRLATIGIEARVAGKSWDEIKGRTHCDVIVYGWGSHDPMEIYHLYHSSLMGQGYYNSGFYRNASVDAYFDQAINAGSEAEAIGYWKLAQWDGKTGCGPRGDAPWACLINLDHVYFVSEHLNIGASRIEPHGHGWPITANITTWTWKE